MRNPIFKKLALLLIAAVLLGTAAAVLISPYRGFSEAYVLTTQALYPLRCVAAQDSKQPGHIGFLDASDRLGKHNTPSTSSLAAVDISGNGRDDLLIGTGNGHPQLLVNVGGRFENRSRMIAHSNGNVEWHSHTAIDIDNDGRLDIASAGGSERGAGTHSRLLRNISNRERGLAFANMPTPRALADQSARSTAILPVASPSGANVDLYAATRLREGHPSRYWNNHSTAGRVQLQPHNGHRLGAGFDDVGRGVFADFDVDGLTDYLVIENARAVIHWGQANTPPTLVATQALSAAAGDFNNDGLLDLYIGRFSPATDGDRISVNDQQLQVFLTQNNRVDHSTLTFRAETPTLDFDLRQSPVRGQRQYPVNGSDIFLGRDRSSPEGRMFTLHKDDAIGRPQNLRRAGIYIWYSDDERLWHVQWQFQNFADNYKGTITGASISGVTTRGFTHREAETVTDLIALGAGDGTFTSTCSDTMLHTLRTSGITLLDVDNDGLLDIAGVRHGEQAAGTGEAFLLKNLGENAFKKYALVNRDKQSLYRADQIVHGFFDDDNRPDLAFTQGYGDAPGTGGPTKLLLNRSTPSHKAFTIDLVGTQANTFGVGARVSVLDTADTPLVVRHAGINTNLSQDTMLVHVGLGESAPPWRIRVQWPDGTESNHESSNPGYLRIRQPRARQ